MRIGARSRTVPAWTCCLLLLLTGCGYVFQGGGSALPPDIKYVQIPLAVNNTAEAGLSSVVTEALRDRFERFGVLFVVDDLSEADAVLETRIVKVQRETRTVTSNTDTDLQLESQLTLACQLRRVTGPVLWRNNNIMVSKAFGTTSDVVVTSSADFAQSSLNANDLAQLGSREVARGQEFDVFETLAEDAAKKVYNEAVAPDF